MIVELALAVAFSFSRTDGNIRPFHAHIGANGSVVVDGRRTRRLSAARFDHLRRVAIATSFAGLPRRIVCPGVLPDVAARNVTFTAGHKVWAVSARGGCNARFERMYNALAKAAGIS